MSRTATRLATAALHPIKPALRRHGLPSTCRRVCVLGAPSRRLSIACTLNSVYTQLSTCRGQVRCNGGPSSPPLTSPAGFKKGVNRATTQVLMKTGQVERTNDRDFETELR